MKHPGRERAFSGSPDSGASVPLMREVPFQLLVESVLDYAIFMLDPGGYIVSWNAGAERIKGYRAEEIVGQHFSIFYSEEDRRRQHPQHELEKARDEGRYEEEGWRYRKDGSQFWASVVITAVRDHDGELLGFGKVTRDLTERKRQQERELELMQERSARAEAEATSRAKTEFLGTISHELRTPLNAIVGHVDLLDLGVQGPLTEAQRSSLERIRRSSRLLLALINDLLNFVRVESGGIQYHIRPVRLAPMVSAIETMLLPQFEAKGISFSHEPCAPDVAVLADPDRVQQILLNLLTNAYKFTTSGGRTWVSCEADEAGVRVRVGDTGRGIPEERLEEIFEPFVQLDRQTMRESLQGVGLGLSISRDIARAMSGDLTVTSRVGEGSVFTLSLVRADVSAE